MQWSARRQDRPRHRRRPGDGRRSRQTACGGWRRWSSTTGWHRRRWTRWPRRSAESPPLPTSPTATQVPRRQLRRDRRHRHPRRQPRLHDDGTVAEHDPDDWWQVVDTNLGGTFHLVQAVLPGMRRRGGGRIVVISSEWGVIGWPRRTAYAASKAGLISLVKTLGRELAPEGILVNADRPRCHRHPAARGRRARRRRPLEAMHRHTARTSRSVASVARRRYLPWSLCSPTRPAAMVGQVVQANGGSTRAA